MLFLVADAVVFRPFPFAAPIGSSIAGENLIAPRSEITYREFKTCVNKRGPSTTWPRSVVELDLASCALREPATVSLPASWSGNFFDLMAPVPLLGRTSSDDDRLESARTVVLSHGFWQRQFGGDAGIIGAPCAERAIHLRWSA
jgi:hypothetical protein